jgi:NAD(P)-dependent dehydrogenase (short-subunit alcohol dehydrogenase family)
MRSREYESEFLNKIVIVTGGNRGIGRSIVLSFAKRGASVVFCYRSNEEKACELIDLVQKQKLPVYNFQADLRFSDQVKKLITSTMDRFGKIDILINNAGKFDKRPTQDISDDIWEEILRVNLYSAFYCSREVLPYMIAAKQGVIINIGSIAGKRGSAFHAHYAAAKGGLFALTRSLAREVTKYNIRVNAICPGRVDTDFLAEEKKSELDRWKTDTPIQRLAEPEEIAEVVVFLASQRASYIIGETIDVDGGLTMD